MAKQEIREFGDFTGENNQGYIIVGGKTADVEGGKKLLSDVIPVVPEQVQSDWEQEDDTQKDYIKNKPDIPTAPDIETTGDGSGAIRLSNGSITLNIDRNSLTDRDDILAVQVPVPDTDNANDGDVLTYEDGTIKWTPPTSQVQADWAQNDNTQKDYIKNKPTVENGAQVNKIEGIVIQKPHNTGDVLPIDNKLVTLNFGTGALVDNAGNLDFYCTAPLFNGEVSDGGAILAYDDTLTLKNNALSVADPLPSKSNENYRKILVLNEDKDAVWSDNISFGSGSEEGGNKYITPKIPVAIPKDFSYSESDQHGYPSDYEIDWQDATPPAPNPGFAYSDASIGTKKSFNLISTVQNINEGFYNTREYDYDWEETQTIPDPKKGSHNGHVLTYDSSEGIVWAAPSPLNSLYYLGNIGIDPQLTDITDEFGTGQDKPLLVPVIEATEIDEDDSSYSVKKIAMNIENVFDLVNKNLQVEWPIPATTDWPEPSQIGDTIEYKLVAEITGFKDTTPQISLYWTKAQ